MGASPSPTVGRYVSQWDDRGGWNNEVVGL